MFCAGTEIATTKLNNKEYIIVATTTNDFVDMAMNWYKSLQLVHMEQYALVIAWEKEAFEKLNNCGIACVYMSNKQPVPVTAGQWYEMEKQLCPAGLQIILNNFDANVIKIDTDVFFVKNFISKLEAETTAEYDISVSSDRRFDPYTWRRKKDHIITINHDKTKIDDWGTSDQAKHGDLSGNPTFIPKRSRKKIVNLLSLITDPHNMDKFPTHCYAGALQAMLNAAIKKTNLSVKSLSVFEFVNGSVWQVPYLQHMARDRAYCVHYNFYSHAGPVARYQEKKDAMIKSGHWLL